MANYNCPTNEIPQTLRELADWLNSEKIPPEILEPANDLLERWSVLLAEEVDEKVEKGYSVASEDELTGEWVVVLNDEETWTSLSGCGLVFLPSAAIDICNENDANHFEDAVQEELGDAIANKIVSLDLKKVLCHGYRLSDCEEYVRRRARE